MAAVPQTHTFADGVRTSSEDNAYIRDPLLFLMARPAARLRQTTLQTLTTATFGSITFTTEDLDSDYTGTEGHSTSVNTSRYTAVYAGWYRVGGGVSFALNATGQRGCRWTVNGTAVNASVVILAAVTGNVTVVPARPDMVFLNVGDYVELQGYQTSGGNLDTFVSAEYSCSMSVVWDRVA